MSWQNKARTRIETLTEQGPLPENRQDRHDLLWMGSMHDHTGENLDDDPAYDRAEHERIVQRSMA